MKAHILLVLALIFTLTFGITVSAQENQNTMMEESDTSNSETIEEKELSCEDVQAKIDEKITFYKARELKHLETYQILQLKLGTITETADTLGYNTSELDKDITSLNLLVRQFSSNFDTFIKNLTLTKSYACLQNQTSYVTTFANTLKALKNVRDSAVEIYDFYEGEIKADVLGLEMIQENE